jgi:hypothetical protein
MNKGGGGTATNSGIDYQQRISALALVHILIDIPFNCLIRVDNNPVISEVRFETNNDIDDIVLVTNIGRLFIQAKRSLSLSDKIESAYSSVLKQFIAQYINDCQKNDLYILTTNSNSSKKITKELKKLTDATRLNDNEDSQNPLKSETKHTH